MKKMSIFLSVTCLMASLFAAPTRSSLGSSGTIYTSNAEPIANPYVTDGLVAMYDGIWNSGLGKHDANTRVWKNLATNLWDGSIGSGVKVGDNCMAFNGIRNSTNAVAVGNAWFGKPTSITIEACFARDNKGSQSLEVVCGGWEGVSRPGMVLYLVTSKGLGAETVVVSQSRLFNCIGQSAPFLAQSITATLDDAYFRVYHNGQMSRQMSGGTLDWSGSAAPFYIGCDFFNPTESHMHGRVFNVRVYSRALTDEEIAANYAVDKVRFNLP